MVRSIAVPTASAWVALFAASAAAAPPADSPPAAAPVAGAAPASAPNAAEEPATAELPPTAVDAQDASSVSADEAQAVKEVTLDPTLKPPVCRRYVPTGSRIAQERCESADADSTAARDSERDQVRRDIDEMRMRQSMRDQARAQALAESLRRAGR